MRYLHDFFFFTIIFVNGGARLEVIGKRGGPGNSGILGTTKCLKSAIYFRY